MQHKPGLIFLLPKPNQIKTEKKWKIITELSVKIVSRPYYNIAKQHPNQSLLSQNPSLPTQPKHLATDVVSSLLLQVKVILLEQH